MLYCIKINGQTGSKRYPNLDSARQDLVSCYGQTVFQGVQGVLHGMFFRVGQTYAVVGKLPKTG